MTPDERDLRRALGARSGEPTPAFRARLSAALAEGRPGDPWPALALVASVVLVVGTVVVLLLVRHGTGPTASHSPVNPPGVSTPPPTSASTISPAPTPTASPTPIAMPTTAEFSAPSSNVLWGLVAGSVLFRSTDRGNTWEQRPLPPSADLAGLTELSFVDDHQGWLMQIGSAATQCQGELTTIWHTTDAGSTWRRMGASGIGDSGCKGGLSFIDPVHGFLAVSDPNHAPVIYRTADAGRTWVPSRPLPDPPGVSTQPGNALYPGRVRAFGSTLLVAAQRYVFRSTDGGATWTYVARTPDGSSSIAFVTPSRWLDLVYPGATNETLDAGATWHAYRSDYDQAAPVAPDVVFGDPEVGYATVRGSLRRTLDGGLHWSALRTPGTG